MSREAMQMALDAFDYFFPTEDGQLWHTANDVKKIDDARQALQQALETEQEPVAWMYVNEDGECEQIEYGPVLDDPEVTPLYTAPPKREWVGLTEEDLFDIAIVNFGEPDLQLFIEMGKLVQEELKEKNT